MRCVQFVVLACFLLAAVIQAEEQATPKSSGPFDSISDILPKREDIQKYWDSRTTYVRGIFKLKDRVFLVMVAFSNYPLLILFYQSQITPAFVNISPAILSDGGMCLYMLFSQYQVPLNNFKISTRHRAHVYFRICSVFNHACMSLLHISITDCRNTASLHPSSSPWLLHSSLTWLWLKTAKPQKHVVMTLTSMGQTGTRRLTVTTAQLCTPGRKTKSLGRTQLIFWVEAVCARQRKTSIAAKPEDNIYKCRIVFATNA